MGGFPFLRARLAIGRDAQSQHVHAHCNGDRRRMGLQRGCDSRARNFSGNLPRPGRRSRGLFLLVLLGQMLELRAREQTSGAIRALLDLAPKTARRVRDDGNDE